MRIDKIMKNTIHINISAIEDSDRIAIINHIIHDLKGLCFNVKVDDNIPQQTWHETDKELRRLTDNKNNLIEINSIKITEDSNENKTI